MEATPDIQAIVENIRARLQASGRSAARVSERAGLGRSFLSDLIAGRSTDPGLHKIELIAEELGCKLVDLLGTAAAPTKRIIDTRDWPGNLPIYKINTVINKSNEGEHRLTSTVIAFAKRPPGLVAPDSYAIYMPDGSMEPWRRIGGLILISPGRPAAAGCHVAITLVDGTFSVRLLIAQTIEAVVLHAHRDQTRQTVRADKIRAMERVVELEDILT